jgi:ubiquinone biosynthesis UbiH/UbiF/VisC/COQ6 family hydroxylase
MDVTVVGAGLVGTSLALACARADLEVALVTDAVPEPAPRDWDVRVYAISPGSRALLAQLGAWPRVDSARLQPVVRMEIFGDDGAARLDFDARAAGVAELACIAESGAVAAALWDALAEHGGCEIRAPARPAGLVVTPEGARLSLEDGSALDSTLVVGADGRESWVRAVAGIEAPGRDYPQHAVVANFACTVPHRGAARQWFRADGVLALLPLPGDRVSMVWSATGAVATELLHAGPAELATRVAAAANGLAGELSVITVPTGFPLRARLAKCFVQPRLALVGDAAHHVHPLAGQGVNLGLRDVRELVAVLAGRGPQRDCGALPLLRRYERARREDALAMLAVTDGLQRLFASTVPGLGRLRNAGLALTGRLPLVRRLLAQHALA